MVSKKHDDKRVSHYLSITDILNVFPISERTLLRMMKEGLFPRAYYLTPNRRVWKESDILVSCLANTD